MHDNLCYARKCIFERFMRENIKQDRQRYIINRLSVLTNLLIEKKRFIVQPIYAFAFL